MYKATPEKGGRKGAGGEERTSSEWTRVNHLWECYDLEPSERCRYFDRRRKRKDKRPSGFLIWISAGYRICTDCWVSERKGNESSSFRSVYLKEGLETIAAFSVPNRAAELLEALLSEQTESHNAPDYKLGYHLEWADTKSSQTNVFYPPKLEHGQRILVLENGFPRSDQSREQPVRSVWNSKPTDPEPECVCDAAHDRGEPGQNGAGGEGKSK